MSAVVRFFENNGPLLAGLGITVFFAFQLITGKAVAPRGMRHAFRADNPRGYWSRLAWQIVGLAIVFKVGDTSSDEPEATHSATVAAVEPAPPSSPREQADLLRQSNQFDSAIAAYDSLLAAAPTDTGLLMARGLTHWRANHPDLALLDYRRVIAIDGTNFTVHQHVDRILSSHSRWDETIALWDAFIARNPTHAGAYLERGGTNFRRGARTAALADADKSCELGNRGACEQAARVRGR